MKLKISTVAIILIAFLFGGLPAVTTAEENNTKTQDVNVLKTNIGELEKTIKTQEEQIQRTGKALDELRKQLDAQIKENDRLRELCKKAGIDTTKEVGSGSTPSGRIIYQGKERDEEWFDRMYERFSDKIALAGDKFVDLRTKPKHISNDFVEVGTIVDTGNVFPGVRGPEAGSSYFYRVISVIGVGEALINCHTESFIIIGGKSSKGSSDFIFHLCGYDQPLIDGQTLNIKDTENLICVGTYKYTTALGAQKTVQSFKVWQPEPLTREQFAEALRSGFELVNYVERQGKTVKVPIR
jgi:hypothetical protein